MKAMRKNNHQHRIIYTVKLSFKNESKICHRLSVKRQPKTFSEPGVVVHNCNPNYLGGRGRRIMSSRSLQAET
jgi:hypothetical protein